MERGTSASGLAYQDGANVRIKKAKGPASEFVKAIENSLPDIARSPRGILHARATTKGSEDKNENNHPVIGFHWAVVHNGMISNDDDLWEYYTTKDRVKRFAEVDTSVIPLVLGRGRVLEESIRNLSVLGGSATIAAWSSKDIERMILARFGFNDLYMFHDAQDDIIYWSSASSAAYLMRGPMFGRHKFLSYSKLAEDHVLVLQPGGFAQTRVFKVDRKPFFLPRGPKPTLDTARGEIGKPVVEPVVQTPYRIGTQAISVSLPTVAQQSRLTVDWAPMERVAGKPSPMHQCFSKSWRSLSAMNSVAAANATPIEQSVGYGRWIWSQGTEGIGVMREFRPYKRTKHWWNTAYKTQPKLPLLMDTAGCTELDNQLAWEHYDINVQLLDRSTRRFLGFMCPMCGVWLGSVDVQKSKERCEYCRIKHRMQPANIGETHG